MQGWFVLQPWRSRVRTDSGHQKTEECLQGCSRLGLLGERVSISYCHFLAAFLITFSKPELLQQETLRSLTRICFKKVLDWSFIWKTSDGLVSLTVLVYCWETFSSKFGLLELEGLGTLKVTDKAEEMRGRKTSFDLLISSFCVCVYLILNIKTAALVNTRNKFKMITMYWRKTGYLIPPGPVWRV